MIICQVFAVAYSSSYDTRKYEKIMATNIKFLESLDNVHLEMMRKTKLHTLLHLLVDDMSDFGPAVGFKVPLTQFFLLAILEVYIFSSIIMKKTMVFIK